MLEKAKTTTTCYIGHKTELYLNQILIHHSGRKYEILAFTNTTVDETEKFPHTVLYRNTKNYTMWTRPIKDIKDKFKFN